MVNHNILDQENHTESSAGNIQVSLGASFFLSDFSTMDDLDDVDINALLDEIEQEKSKPEESPKIAKKKVLVDVDVPFLDLPNTFGGADESTTPSKKKSKKKDLAPLVKKPIPKPSLSDSVVHTGDTDSSDDEENKYFEEKTYNSCGNDIRKLLKSKPTPSSDWKLSPTSRPQASKPKTTPEAPNQYTFGLGSTPPKKASGEPGLKAPNFDSYKDPIFGISIVNPLVSSATLKSRMTGRTPISFFKLKNHVRHGDLKTDWVLGGVIVSKTPTKVSQKGKKYIIWTLSDLKTGLLTAALFLFGRACEKLWKTQLGAVIGVLNPSPLNQNGEKGNNKEKDQAKLSILDPDQVMLLGRSKDLGTCKGKKKDGGDCTAFVNTKDCEYCSYHVASAYKEYRGRAELQSPTCGSLASLKNKVLGKSEVFYGGKSYIAEPSRSNAKKVLAKDKQRLANLGVSGPVQSSPACSLSASLLSARSTSLMSMLESSSANKKTDKKVQSKDLQRLNSLSATPKEIVPKASDALKPATKTPNLGKKPTLSNTGDGLIEFDLPVTKPAVKPATKQLGAPEPVKRPQKPPEKRLQTKFNSLINLKSETTSVKAAHFEFKSSSPSGSTAKQEQKLPSGSSSTHEVACDDSSLAGSPSKVLLERSPSTINALPVKGEEAVKTMVKVITRSPTARTSRAKLKAMQIIKKTGGITRENPRGVTREELVNRGLKRTLDEEEEDAKEELKNSVLSARFIELMNMESRHSDLLKEFDQRQEDAYYEKMERKEQMEEKMMSITKLECKAVRCMKCRYTWFSASDECKAERHPLKVIDALKRFFKCNNCGNRTVSLSILPLLPCKKCSSTSWVKTAMMKERIVKSSHQLSIRGGEQKFVNSVAADANINLLVPDD